MAEKTKDIQIDIYAMLIKLFEMLEPVLNIAVSVLDAIVAIGEAQLDVLRAIYYAATFRFIPAAKEWADASKAMNRAAERIADIFSDDEEDALADPYIKDWLGLDMAAERERAKSRRGARDPDDPGGP